jgi:hypothetical protein
MLELSFKTSNPMSTETNIKFHVFNQAHLYYVNGLADIG